MEVMAVCNLTAKWHIAFPLQRKRKVFSDGLDLLLLSWKTKDQLPCWFYFTGCGSVSSVDNLALGGNTGSWNGTKDETCSGRQILYCAVKIASSFVGRLRCRLLPLKAVLSLISSFSAKCLLSKAFTTKRGRRMKCVAKQIVKKKIKKLWLNHDKDPLLF